MVDLQTLHGAQWAQAKFGTKHGKKPIEKRQRPPNLGEDERDDLENDEEPVENGPKLASGLVRNCAVPKKKTWMRIGVAKQRKDGGGGHTRHSHSRVGWRRESRSTSQLQEGY